MSVGAIFSLGVLDAIDILLMGFLLYSLYSMTRGTAVMRIFVGIAVIYLLWLVVRALNMELTSTILGQIMGVGLIAMVVVFQQEIRRFLLFVGSRYTQRGKPFSKRLFSAANRILPHAQSVELVTACMNMSQEHCGALIAITRRSDLEIYSNTGVKIDAVINSRLLENIFFKNSPLHDGALIIAQDRIRAVQCILPLTDNPSVTKRLGLRHRAAIGLSERTDALVLVVSEETGAVSIVENGTIRENVDEATLHRALARKV